VTVCVAGAGGLAGLASYPGIDSGLRRLHVAVNAKWVSMLPVAPGGDGWLEALESPFRSALRRGCGWRLPPLNLAAPTPLVNIGPAPATAGRRMPPSKRPMRAGRRLDKALVRKVADASDASSIADALTQPLEPTDGGRETGITLASPPGWRHPISSSPAGRRGAHRVDDDRTARF
jgi:hypothetical protein